MIRIRNCNTSVLGYVLSTSLRRWTRQSVDCYYNGLQCKFCALPDDIKAQCKMKPVVLAPMAGVTDKPFRKMVRLFGEQPLYTEMIATESLFRNHPATRKMLEISDEKNIIIQLVGIHPEAFDYAARLATDSGAVALDINMGCPVKKLISNGSGAALLKTPDIAAHLVETVKKATSLPVFVKMRIGWDKDHMNAVPFAKLMESAGADRLTIHARTRDQGYAGIPDWKTVADVKQAVSIPVFANGNITDRSSAEQVLKATHADGIMIGRGALGQPWILTETETGQKPIFDLEEIICQHIDLLMDCYGKHGVFIARKHIAWYLRSQKNVAQFCQNVYAQTDVAKIKEMIHLFLRGNI